ncbi:MAG: hypothetical protein KBT58_02340 [Bizionia sp.]|nr:hypothetical protein [Bizionia sp.]
MKANTILLFFSFFISALNAQVGIGTTNPAAALDITSTNSGLLIPRVALTSTADSTTVKIPNATGIEVSTLVFNDGTGGLKPSGFYYWENSSWLQLVTNEKQVYIGKFKITSTGNIVIAGLPFKPKSIEFKAYANVESYDLNSDNGVGDNIGNFQNYFGYMQGYAKQGSETIEQQVIAGGASANSVNDHSRYASSTKCIGIRYANQNGNSLGVTSAELTSLNADGFTLNVDSFVDGLVVIYVAYKY